MDPLSDILSLLKPRNYLTGGLDAGGDWCLQFGSYAGIKVNAVVSGRCWLSVDGVADSVLLEAGDCFLLPKGRPVRLASNLTLPPIDAMTIFPPSRRGGVAICNGGGDFFLLGSGFTLAGPHAEILLGMLPPVVRIAKEAQASALLRWSLERMSEELRAPVPGSSLVVEHLAHLMLVQALRLYLAEGLEGRVGWLFALADKQMRAAIGHMHAAPAHRWTLRQLAERVGMSRTAFAVKFKATVGVSAMDYLLRWRMLLAADRVLSSGDPLSAVATSLGYESESAFGAAFKRVMGCSPRQYGRSRDTALQLFVDAAASPDTQDPIPAK